MNPLQPCLYLDMDGVLTDYNYGAAQLFNATPEEHYLAAKTGRWPDSKWQMIRNNEHFYLNLPKMPKADQLVEIALKFRTNLNYSIKILTAIPHDNDMHEAFQDKFLWIDKHYGNYKFPVHFGPYSSDKHKHIKNNMDILVDDRLDNCEQWQQSGAIAVHVPYNDYDKALQDLEQIYHDLTTS